MKAKIATTAISIVRAAFAAAWRPAMDAINMDDDGKEIREKMFAMERELTTIETYFRKQS